MPKLKIIWRQARAHKTAAAWALLPWVPRLPTQELAALARLYHKKVIDLYENPRNVGSLDRTSKSVGTGLVGASLCGDVKKLQIQVDEKGKMVDARFPTSGCGSAIASSSLASKWIKGKTVEEALTIKNTDLPEEPCLPPVTLHCSMLAEDAVKAALADYRLKTEPETEEPRRNEPLVMPRRSHRLPAPQPCRHTGVQKPSYYSKCALI